MAPNLAWLGLGNMGRGMCKNLITKGNLTNPLTIYNRTTSRAQSLSSSLGHSTVADTIPSALHSSDIIFLCLGDDAAVLDTIATICQEDIKGKLFVDCSTIHPDTTTEVARQLEGKDARFVACPVFGAPAMADAGQLVCVLAGAKQDVERVKPYCEGVMGRAIIDYSDQAPSKATHLKIIGNTFVLNMVQALSEGHVAAEKSGLGVENLHQFVEKMFPGPYTAYSNRMLSGDYYKREEPLFAVDLARKDARHAVDLAEKSGVEMRAVKSADQYLGVVREEMGARGDIAGIYGACRKVNGLRFENGE